MSIYNIKTTSAEWCCNNCGSINDTAWADWTLGDTGGTVASVIWPAVCAVCFLQTTYNLPSQRLVLAQLGLAEVFNRAKATCHYTGALTSTDADTVLGTLKKLSDYETIPFSIGVNGGKLHYQSAMLEVNAAGLLALAKRGWQFYGTESARKGYIDALTVESATRKILYDLNKVNV